MKLIVFLPIFLLSCLIIKADESTSLRAVLDKSITPGELREDWLAENLKTWPGLKSMEGVAALYDLWSRTKNGDELLACDRIRKRLEVPRSEIVTFLLKRADENRNDAYQLMGYLDHLADYDDDARVSKYYASLLSDKRPLNRNRNPVEGGYTVRVCDVALKNLTHWVGKKTPLKWGDPGFVWDALNEGDFDHNIIAIRPYLIKTGVIEDGKQSDASASSHQRRPIESGTTGKTRPARRGAREDKESITHGEINHATSVWVLAAWGAATLFALGLLWVFLKKRRNVSRPGQ